MIDVAKIRALLAEIDALLDAQAKPVAALLSAPPAALQADGAPPKAVVGKAKEKRHDDPR